MKIIPLSLEGAWLIEAPTYPDGRGLFREWFLGDLGTSFGLPPFQVVQANTSISAKGVIRGIHYSNALDGQSKIVTCTSGSGLDAIVDLRVESETFGKSITIELSSECGMSIFISSGLGHGFQALENETSLTYLLNKKYDPAAEYSVNPLDFELAIEWAQIPPIISEKDKAATSFNQIREGIIQYE